MAQPAGLRRRKRPLNRLLGPLAGLAALLSLQPVQAQNLFQPVYEVLQHPRCSNCHTDTAGPLQRNNRPHLPPVQRGPEGKGEGSLACGACHKERNSATTPGAPDWRMPAHGSNVFRGRSEAGLCRQLRDPAQNGGLQPEALGRHFAEDPLIGWAWNAGAGRAAPRLARDELVAAVVAWLRAGAPCPD